MKNIIIIIIAFLISCNPSNTEREIILIGNINQKVNCEITLSKKGDIIKGDLLNINTNERIKLRGTIVGDHLRIEEYAKKNKLTGIFDGTYKNDIYKGFWKSPNNKIKVPFTFSNKDLQKLIDNNEFSILKIEYLKWVDQINNTDGYCTNEECEKSNGLNFNCGLTIIKKFPSEIIYGDINNDGIEDAFIYAIQKPCMEGTWFINVEMAGHLVVFISNANGTYTIIDEPEVLRKYIDFGRIKKINNGVIYAEGLGLAIDGGAHQIGFKWNCKFVYENNRFHLLSKSKKEKFDE